MRSNGTAFRANKELVKEINSLKVQLKKLSDSMEAESHSGINRTLSTIESKSKEAVDHAISAAQDFIDQYADSARDAARELSAKSAELRETAAESLVDSVQTRPFATVAAIAGIGFLAGFLFRRS